MIPSPLISAHELIAWLDAEEVREATAFFTPAFAKHPTLVRREMIEKFRNRIRYMQNRGGEYQSQFKERV